MPAKPSQAKPSQGEQPWRMPSNNKLYYGDNLEVLRNKIKDESVDLCYIDPPFNSKRNYFQIYSNIGKEDIAQAQAFEDTWEWGDEAANGFDYILNVENLNNNKLTEQVVALIRGLVDVLGKGSLTAYLIHMTLRIVEIHRVLKSTGSFFLHCDPTASHYLKLILDSVFVSQGGDFINEIIWCYSQGGRPKSHFPRKHDVIFWYGKSKEWQFNGSDIRIKYELLSAKSSSSFTKIDDDGRRYKEVYGSDKKKLYKYYEDDGKVPYDWWTDIHQMTGRTAASGNEYLGYPTQKPEALLERIIKASSSEGDVVLDAYCGCGTTIAIAQRLNRRWIGIDITYQSISLILKRLQERYSVEWPDIEYNLKIDGVPRDMESAKALANRKDDKTRKEFEKWAVLTFTNNQCRINNKKGADAGIDGIAHFMIDKEENGKVIFQVKSGGASRTTIAALNSDRLREKAEFGFLISMDEPTKQMKQEASKVGKYKHPSLNREDDRIQIITIAELLDGKRINLPMGRGDTVKSAVAYQDDNDQGALF